MRQLSIFSTQDCFETLILESIGKDEYSEVYLAISKGAITLNVKQQTLDLEKDDSESMINIFQQNFPSARIKGCNPILCNSENITNTILKSELDLLLVEDDELFEDIEKRTGICRINVNNSILPSLLKLDFYTDIKRGIHHQSSRSGRVFESGWSFILSSIELNPSNSIIIQDNYLFHNHTETIVNNIVKIIQKYLDPELIIDFEVLIITQNPGMYNARWFKDYIDDIIRLIYKTTSKSIKIGIVVHSRKDIHHKRIIISNYSFGILDQSFNTFSEKGFAIEKNDIFIRGLFHGVQGANEIPLDTIFNWIKTINRTISDIKLLEDRGRSENSKMTIGHCENRLLKKV